MDYNLSPWEINPDLTEERLTLFAQLITDTRYELRDEHDPDKGDSNYGYGCRSYDRCRQRLIKKSISDENGWPWLRALQNKFIIGKTPIHFYRDKVTSNKLSKRMLTSFNMEEKQHSFLFDTEINYDKPLSWFLIINTTIDHEITSITCIGATYDEIICKWEVPLKPYTPTIVPLDNTISEAVELSAPDVTIPGEVKQEDDYGS